MSPDKHQEPEPAILRRWTPAFRDRHQVTALTIGGAVGSRPVRQCAGRIVMEDDLHPDVGAEIARPRSSRTRMVTVSADLAVSWTAAASPKNVRGIAIARTATKPAACRRRFQKRFFRTP